MLLPVGVGIGIGIAIKQSSGKLYRLVLGGSYLDSDSDTDSDSDCGADPFS
jgi:hypothetical protein